MSTEFESIEQLVKDVKYTLKPTREGFLWVCPSCGAELRTKQGVENHFCDKMKRKEFLSTPVGILSFKLFSEWYQIKRHTKPETQNFLDSAYFLGFIRFAYFIIDNPIPNTKMFFEYAYSRHWDPRTDFTNTKHREYFLKFYDTHISFDDKMVISINSAEKLCIKRDVTLDQFWDIIDHYTLYKMLMTRKIHPAILIRSHKFIDWYQTLPDNVKQALKIYIKYDMTANYLKDHPDCQDLADALVEDIGW